MEVKIHCGNFTTGFDLDWVSDDKKTEFIPPRPKNEIVHRPLPAGQYAVDPAHINSFVKFSVNEDGRVTEILSNQQAAYIRDGELYLKTKRVLIDPGIYAELGGVCEIGEVEYPKAAVSDLMPGLVYYLDNGERSANGFQFLVRNDGSVKVHAPGAFRNGRPSGSNPYNVCGVLRLRTIKFDIGPVNLRLKLGSIAKIFPPNTLIHTGGISGLKCILRINGEKNSLNYLIIQPIAEDHVRYRLIFGDQIFWWENPDKDPIHPLKTPIYHG